MRDTHCSKRQLEITLDGRTGKVTVTQLARHASALRGDPLTQDRTVEAYSGDVVHLLHGLATSGFSLTVTALGTAPVPQRPGSMDAKEAEASVAPGGPGSDVTLPPASGGAAKATAAGAAAAAAECHTPAVVPDVDDVGASAAPFPPPAAPRSGGGGWQMALYDYIRHPERHPNEVNTKRKEKKRKEKKERK